MAVSTSHFNPLTDTNQRAVPVTQVSIAAGSITSSYQAIGSANFANPMVQVIIVSTLNATVQWSWDGVNAAFPIVAGATLIIDMKSDQIVLPACFGPYVKTLGSPSTGSLYVGGFTI